MNSYNFVVSIVDTDSLTIGKPDSSLFTDEEIDRLNKELNSLYGEHIKWDFESAYKKVIAIRTKNYILLDNKDKLTIKGSALKASTKSKKLKQFIKDIVDSILTEQNNYVEIYERYVKEVGSIQDITPWCVRKTITDKVLSGTRKNETNVADAILGSNYRESDRCYMFFKQDGTMCLAENFTGDYSKPKLYQQVYDTMCVFDSILDMSLIKNYKLKRNEKLLALL